MITDSAREIIVEIERVKTIRKRCRTRILFCRECDAETDFITLQEAASLFEVNDSLIKSFVRHHICPSNQNESGMLVCLSSLLAHMQQSATGKKTMIGDKSGMRRLIAG
jgi:hypothetical protein